MAAVMNAVGFDAMTVGNHEFDFGLDQLRRLSKQINFPIIITSMSTVFVFSNHRQSLIKCLVLMEMK
ncbi:5'-nucleotidase [Streptococcus thermophilus]|nr:5'-nucleotidase [Streptococcus thermophilus]